MKIVSIILTCAAGLFLLSCNDDFFTGDVEEMVETRSQSGKVTGDVLVEWPVNNGHENGNGPEMNSAKQGIVELAAFEPTGKKEAKGNFDLTILEDGELHREIKAIVITANVNSEESRAWFLAEVYFDSKPCSADGGSGHGDEGHGDGHDGDDSHHDNAVDHDTDDHGGGCSGGHSDQGNGHVSGKNCRIGQIVAVKVHDLATPGSDGDRLAWKWYAPDAQNLPDVTMPDEWPHLCPKPILSGNLVVH